MQTATPICALLVSIALIATSASAQSATLTGAVLADPSERPIAGAEIRIDSLGLSARSDSTGSFSMAGIPRGVHVVSVRAVGFVQLSSRIAFADGQRVEADLMLARTAQSLDTVDVNAKKAETPARIALRLTGFEERRAGGFGRFITQDVMEKGEGRKLTDVLTERIPGLKRAGRSVVHRGCYVRVFVGGMIQQVPFNTDGLDPSQVAAVEFYSISSTPLQFNNTGPKPCGTLLIWLRG